jgi:prevent-host-death family protein
MKSVQLEEAQAHFPELVDAVAAGQEIIITRDDKPVAILSASSARPSLSSIRPISVGAVLRPLTSDDDLLEEMMT